MVGCDMDAKYVELPPTFEAIPIVPRAEHDAHAYEEFVPGEQHLPLVIRRLRRMLEERRQVL